MTMPDDRLITRVSAPGKVLLTGGYLVLERKYSAGGLVLATTARFHCSCSTRRGSDGIAASSPRYPRISVDSPQFVESQRYYTFDEQLGGYMHSGGSDTTVNPFIDTCMQIAMSYVSSEYAVVFQSAAAPDQLDIVIQADNDFYSQVDSLRSAQLPVNRASLLTLPQFNFTNKTLREVNKTGLGSSAALTSSLVACILSHFYRLSGADGSRDGPAKQLIHNLAQLCHCAAQGKIGSGFDVSSAVYGSQKYHRFSFCVLSDLISTYKAFSRGAKSEFSSLLTKVVESEWDGSVLDFKLPEGMDMVLADVVAGSNTPKMVSKLKDWARDNVGTSTELYSRLNTCNKMVEDKFTKLRKLSLESGYSDSLEAIGRLSAFQIASGDEVRDDLKDTEIFKEVAGLITSFQEIRSTFRRISELADVPIEPPQQTQLLDKCLTIPGVLLAGVPGAGGYDAIVCITISASNAPSLLDALWEPVGVCGLPTGCGSDGLRIDFTTTPS